MEPEDTPELPPTRMIRLDDGREFDIDQLLTQRSRARVVDLRRRRSTEPPRQASTRVKYTVEDRTWQATAPVEQVMQRYSVTVKQATMIKYQSRYILDQLGIKYE